MYMTAAGLDVVRRFLGKNKSPAAEVKKFIIVSPILSFSFLVSFCSTYFSV